MMALLNILNILSPWPKDKKLLIGSVGKNLHQGANIPLKNSNNVKEDTGIPLLVNDTTIAQSITTGGTGTTSF